MNVNVVEEGDLASLVLHWRDATDTRSTSRTDPTATRRSSSPQGAPITYWVTAIDARGNQSRTADQVIAADAC